MIESKYIKKISISWPIKKNKLDVLYGLNLKKIINITFLYNKYK